MTVFNRTGMFFTGIFLSLTANAFEVAQEFSAEAVQSIPGRPSLDVKMFVSKNAVRTESIVNGDTVIEIVYPKENRRILLNKLKKVYVEQKSQINKTEKVNKKSNSPCSEIVNATCKNLGKEKISGRNTIKWEMTVQRNGRGFKSLHWLDTTYNMPLRTQLPDGTVSTMTMSGKENINGRNTEKWEISSSSPNGQNLLSQQWYDPKLKMVIREELPGGYVRELKNISVSKQSKKLFKVPSDYKQENIPVLTNTNMNQIQCR